MRRATELAATSGIRRALGSVGTKSFCWLPLGFQVLPASGLPGITAPSSQWASWRVCLRPVISVPSLRGLAHASARLEHTPKDLVVPLFAASSYAAVFQRSPTGGMVHLAPVRC